MRYLQGTKNYTLTYRHTDHLEVVGYSDADHARCTDTRRSTSGYTFFLLAAVFFSKINKSGSRSKHIDIKYMVVRDRIKVSAISIEHISGELMVADPLTKGLLVKLFKDHVQRMGLISSFNV
ncbi:hypothetical protein CFOL_v3_04170 [Cephalotus follicularis]|uniref:Uncharacterized protein n=1 Tax=Cephalotus follicularis TaxID=3775 RepID=A0A1Q3AY13_CEPFO|nr:hypothetical protein CFOL_v3_04170 [Cephalotus follicularis]